MSFVSASMQVHVQTEPSPASRFSCDRFLSLPPTKAQISSTLKALAGQITQRLVLVARHGRGKVAPTLGADLPPTRPSGHVGNG